ncbi:hypothetical protein [Acinetobacter gerneri]|jgi:hypothetical protein|uniref:Uncharacterized protein n=1 Tax=Acinetobacter gerneri DSM 14967 = CIP 107464 = MTCC 9824 TaxID=1120926 RepID=N8ZNQ6_9GAMM|nr:hypothetical protein [Acinetobacter gerneri]ENV33393.1 hypothetical protein F960_02423 [Acinetobacter gerneri DSM 14967 = CIP 107464 = MTCC 9824]MCH4245582.1 hypothetical protein [Acinetobacter gerneri]
MMTFQPKNRLLYFIHSLFLLIYIFFFLIAVICLNLTLFDRSDPSFGLNKILVLMIGTGLLSYLHYLASIEVLKGSVKGRRLSMLLGWFITIVGFPIFTIIGIIILLNSRKKKFQTEE